MLGIGCDYCAYCLDLALLLRNDRAQFNAAVRREAESQEQAERAEQIAEHRQMMSTG